MLDTRQIMSKVKNSKNEKFNFLTEVDFENEGKIQGEGLEFKI